MELERIRKRPGDFVRANLQNYERCVTVFSWAQARGLLDGLPDGGLNIAHEAVDRHVLAGRGSRLAIRCIGRDDAVRDFSYAELRAQSNRFANVLAQHGISKGDRVFALLGRCPELYMAAFGTLKNGSVLSPLFSAFGPQPIKARMSIGSARVLVTSEAFYRRKIEPWRSELAGLELVLLTECSEHPPAGTMSLAAAMTTASKSLTSCGPWRRTWPCFISRAARPARPRAQFMSMRPSLRITSQASWYSTSIEDDIFWCTADPGWVTGTSYGIVSPLTNGVT